MPKSKKNYQIIHKEWWDEDLSSLAKEMHDAERELVKLHRRGIRSEAVKLNFLGPQRQFDRLFKTMKR